MRRDMVDEIGNKLENILKKYIPENSGYVTVYDDNIFPIDPLDFSPEEVFVWVSQSTGNWHWYLERLWLTGTGTENMNKRAFELTNGIYSLLKERLGNRSSIFYGSIDSKQNYNSPIVDKDAGTPSAQNHGATDSLTKRE